jgi:modulator of FtsH protease
MSPNEFRPSYSVVSERKAGLLATHTVLRNTYLLLSLTLLFSAAVATFAMVNNAAPLNIFVTLIGIYGLMFLTYKLRNSASGIVSVFALTGFMGYTLGPMLNMVTQSYVNGSELIAMSLGGTGLVFFALSAYVLTTRKDFSFMGGFLMTGTIIALVAMVALIFFQVPALYLGFSALVVLLSSGWILWQTSAIINGGETNYIMATVGLYVQIYNLFVSLLQLIMAFAGNRE